jgi:hypothetical protein
MVYVYATSANVFYFDQYYPWAINIYIPVSTLTNIIPGQSISTYQYLTNIIPGQSISTYQYLTNIIPGQSISTYQYFDQYYPWPINIYIPVL